METLELNNGIKIPQLGLGVWQSQRGEETQKAVSYALKTGYRHIDTAKIYGNEYDVGKAIKESEIPREDIFITTKLWNIDHGYSQTKTAFETSLKMLDTDYIDLYLIHFPIGGAIYETWKAMEELYKDGYIKAIGVSNFNQEHLDYLMNNANIVPMINQVEYHPYLSHDSLQNYCKKLNIILEAWSPLGSGRFIDDLNFKKIADKYHKTIPQVILRWEIERGVVTLPKSVHQKYIKENIEIFDFKLDSADIGYINSLNRDWHTGTNPDLLDIT